MKHLDKELDISQKSNKTNISKGYITKNNKPKELLITTKKDKISNKPKELESFLKLIKKYKDVFIRLAQK